MSNIENKCVNAIRVLSADTVQKAKSGHPGMPLGAAPIAYELWAHHMNHNPKNPQWGLIATDSFCQADMRRQCFIPCFIFSATG